MIDAKISRLPVDINAIAALYSLNHLIDDSKSLYENTLFVSEGILKIFGMDNPEFTPFLAVRILAPMIVIKELKIESAEELCRLSGLPSNLSNQRFKRFKMLLLRDSFLTSHPESVVLSQFLQWIISR